MKTFRRIPGKRATCDMVSPAVLLIGVTMALTTFPSRAVDGLLRVPVITNVVDAAVCIPLDPLFVCESPLRSAIDYSDITGRVSASNVVACPCDLIPPSVASTPLTDITTLCALRPRPVADELCDALLPSSAVSANLAWRVSQMPETACASEQHDSRGPCGDPLATQQLALVCALVANASDDHAEVILAPFVGVAEIAAIADLDGVKDGCTKDEFESLELSAVLACADRLCQTPAPLTSVQATCPPEYTAQRTECASGGLNIIAFTCARNSSILTYDHEGCSSSLVAKFCDSRPIASKCDTRLPATAIQMLTPSCTPVQPCGEGTCVATYTYTDDCIVNGTYDSGERCSYECPALAATYQMEQSICSASQCGQNGTASVFFFPCAPNAEAFGCLAYPNAVNSTVACTAEPCPCEGPSCAPLQDTVYPAFGANGEVCPSGVIDTAGHCCIAETHDACGLCPDRAYEGLGPVRIGLDASGSCCSGLELSSPILTASLICCDDASSLDVCGVCGGDGRTCSIAIQPSAAIELIGADEVASVMSKQLGLTISAMPDGSLLAVAGSGAFLTDLAHAYAAAVSNAPEDHAIAASTPNLVLKSIGVHGNGYCESGESPDLEPACAVASRFCPAYLPDPVTGAFVGDAGQACGGNGVCVQASQSCACYYGYTGTTCNACAPGFGLFPTGAGKPACIPVFANALLFDQASDDSSTLAIILGTVASAVVTIVAGVIAKYRSRFISQIANVSDSGSTE